MSAEEEWVFDSEEPEPVEAPPEPPADPPKPEEAEEPPPEEPKEEPIVFSDAQQAKVDQIIDKTTARHRDEYERRLAQEKERIRAELESQYGAPREDRRPEVPDMPDPFDDDFENKVRARDEAISKAAEFDARQRAQAEYQQAMDAQQHHQTLQAIQTTFTGYFKRAEAAGIEDSAIKSAGKIVGESGIHSDVINEVIQDESGPEINVWLAKHPEELTKVSEMTPLKAWAYIQSSVKPKATRKKPAPPPEPAESPKGKGAPPDDGTPDGWSFE